jgi:sugar phosphate isomerase/epimerase
VHVKDMAAGPERRMADPGEGVLDFDAILPAAGAAGVEHYFIEHDYPPDAMATARKGLALLQHTAR